MSRLSLLAALAVAFSSAVLAKPPAISAARLSADVKQLASDDFLGRAPGTEGETRTIAWLIARLKQSGLQPAARGDKWTQEVPLVRTQVGRSTMSATIGGAPINLIQSRDIYVSTVRPTDRVAIAGAPIVFVGYGVSAPERGWDDFKGLDLKGKVAVFLVNDPDFEAASGESVAGKFGGRRMTYYGRWTYKFEEAARRGAIAALIVHDTPGAGYGWPTVTAPAGENFDIVRKDPTSRVKMQGWIEGDAATRLFAAAGLDLAQQRLAARRADFRAIPLGDARFDATLDVAQTKVVSHNVLAKLTGAKRPGEVIIYGAHWDAYGVGAPAADGSTIRAGANDDALGVAGLLEIARVIKAGPRPDRTVALAFWTAEERGLLGSEAYAVDPIFPHARTVANITLDIMQTGGRARDIMLVGKGQTSLEVDLARAAAKQGRTVTAETLPERGLFYRADHLSLARRGVPTLLLMAVSGAPDLRVGGRTAGEAWLKGYMTCYHQTCDRWTPDLKFDGVAEDVTLAYQVGRDLAFSTRWPTWLAGSEFKRGN